MSLNSYLQKHYLSDRKSKRKSKKAGNEGSLVVEYDEPIGTPDAKKIRLSTTDTVPAPQKMLPKQAGTKGWKVVGSRETVVFPTEKERDVPKMVSGASAGLQTGKQVAEQIRAKEEADKRQLTQLERNNETVFRDASGRRINAEKMRAEERAKRLDMESAKERKKKEMNMGLVQKLQQEKKWAELEKAKNSSLTRYADDAELNETLKRKEHQDDPLLSFDPSRSQGFVSLTGRRLYKGGFPENRFGIAPGHRWDGVDRSNGFEKKWFTKQVEREREKTLSYTMQEEY